MKKISAAIENLAHFFIIDSAGWTLDPIGPPQFLGSCQSYSKPYFMCNLIRWMALEGGREIKKLFNGIQIFIICSQTQLRCSRGHFKIVLESVRWIIIRNSGLYYLSNMFLSGKWQIYNILSQDHHMRFQNLELFIKFKFSWSSPFKMKEYSTIVRWQQKYSSSESFIITHFYRWKIIMLYIFIYLLGSDLYTGVALSGAVELPAVFLTYIVIQRAGDNI